MRRKRRTRYFIKPAKLSKSKALIPHTTYKGWMIDYQSPRMKVKIERLSERHLHVVEFRKMSGEWRLVHALWSCARYPSEWLPKLEEYRDRILIDAEKGQELLEPVPFS